MGWNVRRGEHRQIGGDAEWKGTRAIVGLGGVIYASHENGKLYAMGQLEDATGKIDFICFARDYEKLQASLKIEAPVVIRGSLLGEEDSAPKIAINSIQSLEEMQVKLPGGVRIRIDLDRATEEMLVALKSAADAAPGPGKMMLNLEKKGEYTVILEPESMSVAADKGWIERVEELVGRGSVQAIG